MEPLAAKTDMSNQGQTALAAHLIGRPGEDHTHHASNRSGMHASRHPIKDRESGPAATKTVSCKLLKLSHDRRFGAVRLGRNESARTSGRTRVWPIRQFPNIDIEAIAARTNNPVCGAFRGFGANQAQFATEGVLDRLAEKAGLTGWEIRDRNIVSPGVVWGPGQIMDDGCLGARMCLDAIKPVYDEARAAGKAIGLGMGIKNSGLGNGFKEIAGAVVRFEEDGTVEVRHCWTEMGQGIHTVALQVAVEELGIAPERVRVIVDTTRELGAGQTTGSRGTLMGAGSVKDACRVALENDCEPGIDYYGEYRVDWTNSLEEGVRTRSSTPRSPTQPSSSSPTPKAETLKRWLPSTTSDGW